MALENAALTSTLNAVWGSMAPEDEKPRLGAIAISTAMAGPAQTSERGATVSQHLALADASPLTGVKLREAPKTAEAGKAEVPMTMALENAALTSTLNAVWGSMAPEDEKRRLGAIAVSTAMAGPAQTSEKGLTVSRHLALADATPLTGVKLREAPKAAEAGKAEIPIEELSPSEMQAPVGNGSTRLPRRRWETYSEDGGEATNESGHGSPGASSSLLPTPAVRQGGQTLTSEATSNASVCVSAESVDKRKWAQKPVRAEPAQESMSEGDLSPQVNRALERIAQELTHEVSNMKDLKTCENCRKTMARRYYTAPQWRTRASGRCRLCTNYWDGFDFVT